MKKYFWAFNLFSVFLGLGLSCQPPTPKRLTPAFYYWKTVFALSPAELTYLGQLKCKKLYIKHLDIGINPETGAIAPLAQWSIKDSTGLGGREIGSVIFIQQALFQGITESKLDDLVKKILERTAALPFKISEIQFDCDWTPSSRAAYFDFLQKIKSKLPKGIALSATIRLHQYKFPERTGLPPVDKGMLMLYNTGNIEDSGTRNSIFDAQDARTYTEGTVGTYPLPLDLALPLFSWVLVYREGHLYKIIRDFPASRLHETDYFQPNDLHQYHVIQGTYVSGHYLRPDDLLRVEAISPRTLVESAQIAATVSSKGSEYLAFFDLDTSVISQYPVPLLDSLCHIAAKKY